MSFGMHTHNGLWGVPSSDSRPACPASQWTYPRGEWRCLNIEASANLKPSPAVINQPVQHLCIQRPNRDPPAARLAEKSNAEREPIWKRRGAKPIPRLQFHPVIRGDINWIEKACDNEDLLHIVDDAEWQVLQPNYFEVHSLKEIEDGIVIDPPTYPSEYVVPSIGTRVPALLPNSFEMLLNNAMQEGFSIDTLIRSMGTVICNYAGALIHRKRRHRQEVLILARQKSWQGASAIAAATMLLQSWIRVSVFILEPRDSIVNRGTKEEDEFIAAGGRVYRNLEELMGSKFRVVVVALEDQHSGRKSNLPLYGEWLQHSVALFVDPPILKCSYTTALQIATRGCYNMCQKTILLMPFLPKPFIADNFVELMVVDCGIKEQTQMASGVTQTIFPRLNGSQVETIVPVEFKVKGSRLYFYKDGKRLPY